MTPGSGRVGAPSPTVDRGLALHDGRRRSADPTGTGRSAVGRALCLRNRQRVCPIDLRLFRRILRSILQQHFESEDYELCFHFVEADEMARMNEEFLGHVGPTDVITFDHGKGKEELHGEIFICPAVAVAQARDFRTTWQAELVRYAIHGLLHLKGHDDRRPAARQRMKREEDRLLTEVTKHFAITRLQRPK